MTDLDQTDRTILRMLQQNGRTSYAELGKEVGLAVSSVNDRVRKLQERGVIEGVYTSLSASALGLDLLAFVFVGWNEPDTEEIFLQRISEEPAILECHHVTGAWNYLIKVRTRTTRELEAFLGALKKSVAGMQRTETLIVLSSPKETPHLPVA